MARTLLVRGRSMTPRQMSLRHRIAVALVGGRRVWAFDQINQHVSFAETTRRFAAATHIPTIGESKPSKVALYTQVNAALGNQPIDYLEFGVWKGWSFGQWLKLNRHPDSRFYGFDSWEGLPEDWHKNREAGAFSTDGQPPAIEDARGAFLKGWFHDTLPMFLRTHPLNRPTVIHIDCDLYGGTLYALASLDPYLPHDVYVLFDEFYDVQHEFKGFTDYCKAFMREWEPVAYRDHFVQVAIRLLPRSSPRN